MKSGKHIVLTAPLTEMIDHAGSFIQMAMASLPVWMQGVLDRKYPTWKQVKRFSDDSAKLAPAGLRILEKVMIREFGADNVASAPRGRGCGASRDPRQRDAGRPAAGRLHDRDAVQASCAPSGRRDHPLEHLVAQRAVGAGPPRRCAIAASKSGK